MTAGRLQGRIAVVLGAATAFVGQALVLSRGTDAELRGRCRAAARFTLAASTVVGGLLAVAALPFAAYSGEPSATDPVGAGVSGGELAGGFVALGLVLPLMRAGFDYSLRKLAALVES